jgi:Methyltransferase domain
MARGAWSGGIEVAHEAALRAYSQHGHRTVQGWLDPTAVEIIATISRQQTKLGVSGGVCEIGIHHGRLFILLHLLRHGNERSAAYDLFEMQQDNVDASGLGDKAVFLDNLRRLGGDSAPIVVKSRNSLDMTADEVRADAGPVRLFSVDGGHTADITASDLALAEASLCPGGVVILDDYFNQEWPGVSEGAARYLGAGASHLVPVAIGGNKFILTNTAQLAVGYREALRALPDKYVVKDQIAFGAPVMVVQPKVVPLTTRLASTGLWRQIKGTPTGRVLKAAALRVLHH